MNNAYAQGYHVNIQLREGERLTRNWINKGLEINPGGAKYMGPVNKPIHAALGDHPLRSATAPTSTRFPWAARPSDGECWRR